MSEYGENELKILLLLDDEIKNLKEKQQLLDTAENLKKMINEDKKNNKKKDMNR